MKFYAPKYKQLDLGLLRSSLDELDKTNRWVALGDFLPWTELEKEYNSRLDNQKKGAGNKPARMILGAMIIKHKLNLSDAETIEIIRESPYMQYFCGLHEFTDKPIFDPSLFVTIRIRIAGIHSSIFLLGVTKDRNKILAIFFFNHFLSASHLRICRMKLNILYHLDIHAYPLIFLYLIHIFTCKQPGQQVSLPKKQSF